MRSASSLLGLALLALALTLPFSTVFANTGSEPSEIPTRSPVSVEVYIEKIASFINRTLELAERYGVAIPDNLSERVDRARNLITRAFEVLGVGNVTEAITYATLASREFAPVAIYVWRHVYEEKRLEAARRRVEVSIEVRERILEKVEAMVRRLRQVGVSVPVQVVERLSNLSLLLEKARTAVEHGNLSVAERYLRAFDLALYRFAKQMYTKVGKQMHAVAAAVSALRGVGKAVASTGKAINVTIDMITRGRVDSAVKMLTALLKKLTGVSRALDRIYTVADSRGVDEEYLRALDTLRTAINETVEYISTAVSSLKENDTETAVSMLLLAVDTISDALNRTALLKLSTFIKERARVLHDIVKALRRLEAVKRLGAFAKISRSIDRMITRLEKLKRAAMLGKVEKEKVVEAFKKALQYLERLKRVLEHRAPLWLLKKIDAAIRWIESNMPR